MRAIWEGSISFGLINIPVRLYTASRERKLAFHYLHKGDLCPIKYMKVCKTTGEEIPYREIVRGYEYEKGNFVILEDKDFEKADVKMTHLIDVFQFVDEKEIDSIYLEKPYYLEPQKNASNAFALLREALNKTKKVGVAKFVLRTREYLAMVRPSNDLIILNQLRYEDEIVPPNDLTLPSSKIVQKRELDIAIKLVEQLSEKFKISKYRDTYTESLQKIIAIKTKGKVPKAKGKVPIPTTEMEDIIEKLKQSLKSTQRNK